jgi:hypothetical protein
MDNNKSESSYFIPILSALAGVGALVTTISPLFFQNSIINKLFIDSSIVEFIIPLTIVGSLVALWQTTSIRSYSLFNNVNNWEKIKLNFLLFFAISALIFYMARLLAINNMVQKDLTSLIQFASYFSTFFCLACAMGLLLRDTLSEFRNKEIEASKYDRIKESLIKSGKVKLDLIIETINNHNFVPGESFNLISSKEVIFKSSKKTFFSILDNDYSHVLTITEIPKTNSNSKG